MADSVHCRIGSLEMNAGDQAVRVEVHCRIGSLESHLTLPFQEAKFTAA